MSLQARSRAYHDWCQPWNGCWRIEPSRAKRGRNKNLGFDILLKEMVEPWGIEPSRAKRGRNKNLGFDILLKEMVEPWGIEPQTSTMPL